MTKIIFDKKIILIISMLFSVLTFGLLPVLLQTSKFPGRKSNIPATMTLDYGISLDDPDIKYIKTLFSNKCNSNEELRSFYLKIIRERREWILFFMNVAGFDTNDMSIDDKPERIVLLMHDKIIKGNKRYILNPNINRIDFNNAVLKSKEVVYLIYLTQ